jgi:antirestriction protein ArdC
MKEQLKKFLSAIGKIITFDEVNILHNDFFNLLPEENNLVEVIWNKLGNLVEYMRKNNIEEITFTLKDQALETKIKKALKQLAKQIRIKPEELENLGIPFSLEVFEENNGLGKPVDVYQMVTDRIIEKIKSKDFSETHDRWENIYIEGNGFLMALNYVSKKPYSGINQLLLGAHPLFDEPLQNPYFMTFKQVQKLNGKVKKGSKGHEVTYYNILYSFTAKNGQKFKGTDKKKFTNWIEKNVTKDKKRIANIIYQNSFAMLKYYKVFNGKDIEGIDFKLNELQTGAIREIKDIEVAEKIVKNYPAPKVKIEHKNQTRAFYSSRDYIVMPLKEQFFNMPLYYSTLFHELIHSTGASKRLNRDMGGKFGSSSYAFEELVAELGSSYLSAEAGILHQNIKYNAKYLDNWQSSLIKTLKKDNRYIFKAAAKSQKAADYILQRDQNGVPKYQKRIDVKNSIKSKSKNKASRQTILDLQGTAETKETIAFNKEILKAKKNGIKDNESILLGSSKNILKKYIGKSLISISGKAINKSMKKDSDHIAEWHHFINLPDYINRPVAIFKSKSIAAAYIVLTELRNHKNKPLIVALHINKSFAISKIASVYSKNNFSIYEKWEKEGLLLYKRKGWKNLLPAPIALSSSQPLNKGRKNKCKNQNNNLSGLGLIPFSQQLKSNPKPNQTYKISGAIRELLGDVEIKPYGSVAITIDAPQGAGKTTFAFQFIEEFAKNGYKCLFASLEEHKDSNIFKDKANRFLSQKAKENFYPVSDLEDNFETLKKMIPFCDIIIIDSWNKLLEIDKAISFDNDLRKAFDGKLFLCIFQRTVNGTMRGGASAGFDGDIILKMHKDTEDFNNNFVYADKNRYNGNPLNYNVAKKAIIKDVVQPS